MWCCKFEFVWISLNVCLLSESSPTLCTKSFAPENYFQVHHFLLHLLENWASLPLAKLHPQEIQVTSSNCELDAAFLQMFKTIWSRLPIPQVPTHACAICKSRTEAVMCRYVSRMDVSGSPSGFLCNKATLSTTLANVIMLVFWDPFV